MAQEGMTSERSSSLGSLTDTDSAYGTESQYSGDTSRPLSRSDSGDTLSTDAEDVDTSEGYSASRGQHPSADTMEVETRGSHRSKDGDEDETHEQEVTFKVNKRTGEVTMETDDVTKYKKDSDSCHGDSVTREGVRVALDPEDAFLKTDAVTHFKVTDHEDTAEKESKRVVDRTKEVVSPHGTGTIRDQNITSSRKREHTGGSESVEDTDLQVQSPSGELCTTNIVEEKSDRKSTSDTENFQEKFSEETKKDDVIKRQRFLEYDTETSDGAEQSKVKVVTEDTGDQLRQETMETNQQTTRNKVKEAECSHTEQDGVIHHDKTRVEGNDQKKSSGSQTQMTATTNDGRMMSQSESEAENTESQDLSKTSSSLNVDPSGLVKQSSHDQQSKHSSTDNKSSSKVVASSGPGSGMQQKMSSSSQQVQRQSSSSSSSSSSASSSSSSSAAASSLPEDRNIAPGSTMADKVPAEIHKRDLPFLKPILVKGTETYGPDKRHLQEKLDLASAKQPKHVRFGDVGSEEGIRRAPVGTVAPLCSMEELDNMDSPEVENVNFEANKENVRTEENKVEMDSDQLPATGMILKPSQDLFNSVLTPGDQMAHQLHLAAHTVLPPIMTKQKVGESFQLLATDGSSVPSKGQPEQSAPWGQSSELSIHPTIKSTLTLDHAPVPVPTPGPCTPPTTSLPIPSTPHPQSPSPAQGTKGGGDIKGQLSGQRLDPVTTNTQPKGPVHKQTEELAGIPGNTHDTEGCRPLTLPESQDKCHDLDLASRYQALPGADGEGACHIHDELLKQHAEVGQPSPGGIDVAKATENRADPKSKKSSSSGSVNIGILQSGKSGPVKSSSTSHLSEQGQLAREDDGNASEITQKFHAGDTHNNKGGHASNVGQASSDPHGLRTRRELGASTGHRERVQEAGILTQTGSSSRADREKVSLAISDLAPHPNTGKKLSDTTEISVRDCSQDGNDGQPVPKQKLITRDIPPALDHKLWGEESARSPDPEGIITGSVTAGDSTCMEGQLNPMDHRKLSLDAASMDSSTSSSSSEESSEDSWSSSSEELSEDATETAALGATATETSTNCSDSQQKGASDSSEAKEASMEGRPGQNTCAATGDVPTEKQQTDREAERPPSVELDTDSEKIISETKTPESLPEKGESMETGNTDEDKSDSVQAVGAGHESCHGDSAAAFPKKSVDNSAIIDADVKHDDCLEVTKQATRSIEGDVASKDSQSSPLDPRSSPLAPLADVENDALIEPDLQVWWEHSLDKSHDVSSGSVELSDINAVEPRVMESEPSTPVAKDNDDNASLGDECGATAAYNPICPDAPWEDYADTDFTEDSEQTFVMNTDLDDELSEPYFEPQLSRRPPLPFQAATGASGSSTQGKVPLTESGKEMSMTDKLNMISQSGVLSGQVTRKTMTTQNRQFDVVNIQDKQEESKDDAEIEKRTLDVVKDSENMDISVDSLDDGLEDNDEAKEETVAMDTITEPTQELSTDTKSVPDKKLLNPSPIRGSMAAILNMESGDIGDEVNLSTFERKRKRARSEEKTASSHRKRADQELSQQDVEDAVKKLRQSAEDSLKSHGDGLYHNKHPSSNRRRYDWNTHHFFPDIHDFDVGILFTRKGSGDKRYRRCYIEEDWLRNVEAENVTMETEIMDDKLQPRSDLEEDGTDSSCGDDIPKVWRKNPLLVRRKKRSERRLSQEIRSNNLNDTADEEVATGKYKQGFESPSLRKKLNSPRSRRSPRRMSNPTQSNAKTVKTNVRHNSDLVQEKLEQFQELQRRRRALESTSEENIGLSRKKDGRRILQQTTDYKGRPGLQPVTGRAYSQEDIRYEEQGKSAKIQSNLSPGVNTIQNTRLSANVVKPLQTSPARPDQRQGGRSQYDFLSLEDDRDRSIEYHGVYQPGQDQRKALEDYKNISSSFENIYDAVDLSLDSRHGEKLDVNQYMRQNLIEARQRLNKLRQEKNRQEQSRASVQATATQIFESYVNKQRNSTEQAVPSVSLSSAPGLRPKDSLSRLKCQPQDSKSDGSQPATPTSPVWYVPKPVHQYNENIPLPEKEVAKKSYDAKVLMEEEQKKFEDYKRAYARKLSERDSTSGTSGDEQHGENKTRVIPPDDYDYILRKIHHKRQDALYAESSPNYRPQERKKHMAQVAPVDPRKPQVPGRQQTYLTQPIHQSPAHSPGNFIHSLHLPLHIQHERSASQLSTESSRELDQYFPGAQKNTSTYSKPQEATSYKSEVVIPEKSLVDHQRHQPKLKVPESSQVPPVSHSTQVDLTPSQPDLEDECRSVEDKMKIFEKLQSVHAELKHQRKQKPIVTTANYQTTEVLQVYSKPPMPKREDFTPQEPSHWNYNTVYGRDDVDQPKPKQSDESVWVDRRQELKAAPPKPERLTPVNKPQPELHQIQNRMAQSESNHTQSPRHEEYGLVLRLTPQGMLASSPSLSDTQSDPQSQGPQKNLGVPEGKENRRPASSTFYDLGPQSKCDSDRPQYPIRHEGMKDWRSQEDFQFLKDGVRYREKNPKPFTGHNLDRDLPGPPKTPPTSDQPLRWEVQDQAHAQVKQSRYQTQLMSSSYDHLPKMSRDIHPVQQSVRIDKVYRKPESDRSSEVMHKSWSSRINEVDAMKPSRNQDQSSLQKSSQASVDQQKDLTRSFAIVAVADTNKTSSKKQPFKTYDEKVHDYGKEKPQMSTIPLERQLSSPNERSPHQSRASSQYEEHVKRTQEKYKSQTQASSVDDVDKTFLSQRSLDSDYVDPNVIRHRKGSSDSSHSPVVQKSSDQRLSYGLQIHVEKGEPKVASEVVVKLSRSKDDLREQADEEPKVSVSTIKQNLFGSNLESLMKPTFKQELEEVLDRPERKVSELKSDIFCSKDEVLPGPRSQIMSASTLQDEDNDERLLHYVSYKDGQARKRSNIFDVLTDLERTYEKLNLDSEDIIDNAERREYIAKIQAHHANNLNVDESDVPNVKRLSITNVKMLEDLQRNDDNPSLEYAKKWIEEDSTRASEIGFKQIGKRRAVTPTEERQPKYPAAPSDSGTSQTRSGTRSSFPRKVKDDMAYRRQNRPQSMGSQPDLPESTTMSYLAKSPTVSPSQSVESLVKRGRSKTPDAVLDDMRYRHMLRAKSPGSVDLDPKILSTKSPTSTDYLVERTTEAARSRMRIRPEPQADKYHDDLAYRQLRKDVTPLVAELPDKYYVMRGGQSLRNRSQSLDRASRGRPDQKETKLKVERSHSLGPSQRRAAEEASLSKGVAHMVEHFNQPLVHTQSAPDLAEALVFGEDYNAQGDLVTDNPKYSKYAQKPKKQQTPRTVKMRNEMKSKMRLLKHSADSGYMEQSESDASHSSSGPEGHRNISPPDGNFDSDHDLSFSDPNSDRDVNKNTARYRNQYCPPNVGYGHRDHPVGTNGYSQRKYISDNTSANTRQSHPETRPAKDLPPHTFVFRLPQQTNPPQHPTQQALKNMHRQDQPSQGAARVLQAPLKQSQPRKNEDPRAQHWQQHLQEIQQYRKPEPKEATEPKPVASVKPAPPTRVSSLSYEPGKDGGKTVSKQPEPLRQTSLSFPTQQSSTNQRTGIQQIQATRQKPVTQQRYEGPKRPDLPQLQPAAVGRYYAPPGNEAHATLEDRKSWPVSRVNTMGTVGEGEKIEITHPATIETQESQGTDQNLQKRYRRSWHEPPLVESEDGQQVKVEFAFKAPEKDQWTKGVPPTTRSSVPDVTATNAARRAQFFAEPKPTTGPNSAVTRKVVEPKMPTPLETKDHKFKLSQSVLTKPQTTLPQKSEQQTPAIHGGPEMMSSQPLKQAKCELPVIRSKPQNKSTFSSVQACSVQNVTKTIGDKSPSYTIVPITKKSPPARATDVQKPQSTISPPPPHDRLTHSYKTQPTAESRMSQSSSGISSPISDSSSKVSSRGTLKSPTSEPCMSQPTSPKSKHFLLKNVKSVVQKSPDSQPSTQRRTTQIEMVSSTCVPVSAPPKPEQPKKVIHPEPAPKTAPVRLATKDVQRETPPVVTVTKHQSESSSSTRIETSQDKGLQKSSSHMVVKQMSDISQMQRMVVNQKSTHDRVFKMATPSMKILPRGSSGGLLSPPTSGKGPMSLLDRMRLSPAERGFLSPPPRRAGLDHFELSDGDLTDATDITLDGLVRSNLARPSSPETLDFSDFCDNVSENEDSSSGHSQREYSVSGGHVMGKPKNVTVSKSQTEKTFMQKSDATSVVTRTVTRTEQLQKREVVTKEIVRKQDDDAPLDSPSFKDLVKSFESKTVPFMRAQDPQRSASSEQIPVDVAKTVSENQNISRTLKQMSGSDPNLSQGRRDPQQPPSPTWRRY